MAHGHLKGRCDKIDMSINFPYFIMVDVDMLDIDMDVVEYHIIMCVGTI